MSDIKLEHQLTEELPLNTYNSLKSQDLDSVTMEEVADQLERDDVKIDIDEIDLTVVKEEFNLYNIELLKEVLVKRRKPAVKNKPSWATPSSLSREVKKLKPYNKCSICKMVFTDNISYSKHLKTHKKPPKQMTCEICLNTFWSTGNLKTHQRSCQQKKLVKTENLKEPLQKYECSICHKVLPNSKSYAGHKRHHGISRKRVRCNICQKSFLRSSLTAHKSTCHPQSENTQSTVVKQEINEIDTDKSPGQTVSEETIDDSSRFTCPVCNKVLPNSKRYRSHRQRHIKKRCKICNKLVRSRGLITHHKQFHEQELKCPICEKVYTFEKYYKQHLMTHEKTILCGKCDEKFSTTLDLEVHNKINHPELFCCNRCTESFKTKKELQVHKRKVHLGGLCPTCGKVVKDLSKHKVSHTKPYKCNICNISYGHKQNFVAHINKHVDKKCQCDVCGKELASKSTLYNHKIGIHSDKKRFKCEQCGKRFHFKQSLKGHIRSHLLAIK